jgi:hypothetical protein
MRRDGGATLGHARQSRNSLKGPQTLDSSRRRREFAREAASLAPRRAFSRAPPPAPAQFQHMHESHCSKWIP